MKLFAKTTFLMMLILAGLSSCRKDQSRESLSRGDLRLQFHPVVDNAPLDFTNSFLNGNGETYTIKTFRFYIHNIKLIKQTTGEVTTLSSEHYLIDAADPTSLSIQLKPITNNYSAIAFTIGVDSILNVSGAQTGALDPGKGMFWTWSTGYIMAKFEGSSPVSTQPNNRFEYHIGGFKGPDNVVKEIVIPFAPAEDLRIIQGKMPSVDITANANVWFNGQSDVYISVDAVCMTPGTLAKTIAGNYYNMFAVTDVSNN